MHCLPKPFPIATFAAYRTRPSGLSAILLPAWLLLSTLAGSHAVALARPLPQTEGPRTVVRTDYDEMLLSMLEHHGGQQRLESLGSLKFRLVPVELKRGEDGEIQSTPLEPLDYTLDLGIERRVRIEEMLEEKHFVKLIDAQSIRVYMEGEPQAMTELERVAGEQAIAILRHLDLAYGLMLGRLEGSPSQMRTRQGVEYRTIECGFQSTENQSIPRALLYVHPTSLRVERYDLFDPQTNRRTATVVLSDFADLEGLPFATRLLFLDREGEALLEWRIEALEAGGKPADELFERP